MDTAHPIPLADPSIRAAVAGFASDGDAADTGPAISGGDGLARVSGLREAMLGEMVAFADGRFGLALNLDAESNWRRAAQRRRAA